MYDYISLQLIIVLPKKIMMGSRMSISSLLHL
jgi:hypothetical protein